MSERDFQSAVLSALDDVREVQSRIREVQAEVVTDLKSVKEHLVRLNGKVADQERRVGALELDQARREGAASSSRRWMDRLWPAVWAAGGAFVLMLLSQADMFLKHLLK